MPSRNHATPVIIQGEHAIPLVHVPLDQRKLDEGWLQRLLFDHPQLLPIHAIEPVFGPALAVARQASKAEAHGPQNLRQDWDGLIAIRRQVAHNAPQSGLLQ